MKASFKRSLLVVTIVAMLMSFSAVQAQTSVTLPQPTGSYPVGRTVYQLIDQARDEVFTADPADKRELMITVHYPAAPAADAQPALYSDDTLGAALAQMFGIPPVINQLVLSHAYANAPLASAEAAYPVVVFSPGLGNFVLFYTAALEELASHGYVVVSISRPYSDPIVTFPDGRLVLENELGGSAQFLTATTQDELIALGNKIVPVWVADSIFVLNQLGSLNQTDPILAGKLDLEHVGIFGQSMGGIAASSAIYADPRFDAGISMDGGTSGEVVANGVTAPFMFMIAEPPQPTDEEIAAAGMTREQFERVRGDFDAQVSRVMETSQSGYLFELKGSAHNTYTTDFVLLAPIMPDFFTPDRVGTIDGQLAVQIINSYVVGFFDKHLKGAAVPLLDACGSTYPEVTFEPASAPCQN